MEIERKFLLRHGLPVRILNEAFLNKVALTQGYLPVETGEARLRRENRLFDNKTDFFLTVKSEGGLVRQELKIPISETLINQMWRLIDGAVYKHRYTFARSSGKPLELDIYTGNLAGLLILECKFDSVEEAQAFVLPDWVHNPIEVTEDKRFKNKNLARNPAAVAEFLLRA